MSEKVQDYITGNMVEGNPEEVESVQPLLKILVEDYEYPKDCIISHPQYRVKARPSDKKKEYPVDVAVFTSSSKKDDELLIVGECKKKSRKDGQDQLEDYMRLCRAKFGIWTNGKECLYLQKIEHDGVVEFEEIPNIPKFGQRVEDIGKYLRKNLRATHNLKHIFRAIRNYLAGNAIGVTTDEVLAQQLINIIFCKIYDEKFTAEESACTFRAGIGEDKEVVAERVLELFESVKVKYKDVIADNDEIILDASSIVYVVGALQSYCLMDSERDVVADAFEVFIDSAVKGGQGQFFTSRNVARMIVRILDPDEDDTMIDTCCGSGGFPIETMRYVWDKIEVARHALNWSDTAINEDKKDYAMSKLCGLEKDAFLTKITKAYMAILGDGKSGIFCEDSLENPKNWSAQTKVKIKLGSFSMLMTNPPFGKEIEVSGKDKLSQYEFGYKWKNGVKTDSLKDKENPQVIFIERDLQMLKDGGKMAIILPETYCHAPSTKYIIKHIAENNNIFAVVDLPHNTFRPHCNAKCVVLFIEKNMPQQDEITMGVVEEMGHNHLGKPIYRIDRATHTITDVLWDDTNIVAEEFLHPNDPNNKLVFTVNKNDIIDSIYVPRYYFSKKTTEIVNYAKTLNIDMVPIQTLIDEGVITFFDGNGSPASEYKGIGDRPYIRVKDIVDWSVYHDPTAFIPQNVFDNLYVENKKLYLKDILFVRRGSYRIGDVALVSPSDIDVILTREILVLRVVDTNNKYGITPEYLLYALSHEFVHEQIENKVFIDTTLPNIGERWKDLLIPVYQNKNKLNHISNELASAFEEKWSIQAKIDSIRTN